MLKNILNKYSKKIWKCAEKKSWSARSDKSEEKNYEIAIKKCQKSVQKHWNKILKKCWKQIVKIYSEKHLTAQKQSQLAQPGFNHNSCIPKLVLHI